MITENTIIFCSFEWLAITRGIVLSIWLLTTIISIINDTDYIEDLFYQQSLAPEHQ